MKNMIREKIRQISMRAFHFFRSQTRLGSKIINYRFNFFQILYVLIITVFMAGIVNAVFFPVPNQGFIIYPQPGAQSIPETFIDIFVILLGGLGVYISYMAGKQTTKPRIMNIYLLLSLFLLFLSLIMGIYIFATK